MSGIERPSSTLQPHNALKWVIGRFLLWSLIYSLAAAAAVCHLLNIVYIIYSWHMAYLKEIRFLLALLLPLNSANGMCSFKAVSLSRKPFPIL